jgi:CheY-like chemotaxis protein
MLVCDGVTSAKMIRELEARIVKRKIPIIIISGYSLGEVKDQLSMADIDAFIGKPVDFALLQTMLV